RYATWLSCLQNLLAFKSSVSVLPKLAEDFASEMPLPGLAVADHSAAGADDGDPQAVEDRRQIVRAFVNTPPRLAHPLAMGDDPLAVRAVLQVQPQLLAGFGWQLFKVPDVAFALEHFGQTAFDFGEGHFHAGPFHANRIADASQHVGDGVGHHRVCILSY